jgi:hypothetical protein
MSEIRELLELKFRPTDPLPAKDIGEPGELKWIEIGKLVVDASYQRDILADGKTNVRRVIEEFAWIRFAPLVVSQRPGGRYAIIDGQHRATAAKLHPKISKLPCYVVDCDLAEEARAFAAINGNLTRPNPLQIFHARLVAGDASAKRIRDICERAGVSVPRNILQVTRPGQTLAIGTLQSCAKTHGEAVLTQALQLITRTGDGNTGLVRAAIVQGLCDAITARPLWQRNPSRVRDAVERAAIAKLYQNAKRIHGLDGGAMHALFAAQLKKAVDPAFDKVAA